MTFALQRDTKRGYGERFESYAEPSRHARVPDLCGQVVVMEAHNQNPLYFLRDNESPEVVEVLRQFDEEIGADTFRLCAVSERMGLGFPV